MKARSILLGLMFLPLFCAVAVPARAQTGNDDFQQAVAAYQQSHNVSTATNVIKLAAAMDKLPPIPEEARRHYVRGTTLFKQAKSTDDIKQAADEFEQATRLAPWWPEARFNYALALEGSTEYDSAIICMKLYLLFKLPDSDSRAAQDKIYSFEAEQEKATKAKEEENSPQAAAAREQKSFEDLLRKIDGRRYANTNAAMSNVIDINGSFLTEGQIWPPDTGPNQLVHPGYNKNESIEIQGRVTDYSQSGQFKSEQIRFVRRFTISQEGDTITRHISSTSASFPDQEMVFIWQR